MFDHSLDRKITCVYICRRLFPDSFSSGLTRKSSFGGGGGKENSAPPTQGGQPMMPMILMPPPCLSEETLMAPEHNEIVAKIKFISTLSDIIIHVARDKGDPLSAITEGTAAAATPSSGGQPPNSRKLQQLLLYMRCIDVLGPTLKFCKAEFETKRLKPSTTVKKSKKHFTYT